MNKVLFFTYADRKYDFFAVPYIFFALYNNSSSQVEIAVEDKQEFFVKYGDACKVLEKYFPGRFVVRQSLSYKGVLPNTVRFIEKPILQSEYLYIGDIDLLVFEDVCNIHCAFIDKYNLPFSNVIRDPKALKKKLSGLHFCKYNDYYPLPDISDLNLKTENDEHVLYECMNRKNLMVPDSFRGRPECGIHMSLSRDPLARTNGAVFSLYKKPGEYGWACKDYYEKFLQQIKSEQFCALYPYLDQKFKLLMLMLESMANDQVRELHRMACAYVVDKRYLLDQPQMNISEFLQKRKDLINEKKFSDAFMLGGTALIIWPLNISIWNYQLWLSIKLGLIYEAEEILKHMVDFPEGIKFISDLDYIKPFLQNNKNIYFFSEILKLI